MTYIYTYNRYLYVVIIHRRTGLGRLLARCSRVTSLLWGWQCARGSFRPYYIYDVHYYLEITKKNIKIIHRKRLTVRRTRVRPTRV